MAQFVSDLPSIDLEVNDETIVVYFKVTSYFRVSGGATPIRGSPPTRRISSMTSSTRRGISST